MIRNNKILYYSVLQVFILFLTVKVHAQQAIEIGKKIKLNSIVLGEEREILISLPPNYDKKKSYPVCYFFDGEGHFENLVAQTRRLSEGLYASVPETILVGILHKDRSYELTPSAAKANENTTPAGLSKNGGYKNFVSFIQDDLKPYIKKNYNVNNFDFLIGHSFGGLAVLYTWENYPELFQAYVAIDPSMWWDDKKLLGEIDNSSDTNLQKNKILFLAKANDPGSGSDHHNAILETSTVLAKLYKQNIDSYQYRFYPEEDHSSIVVPAEYDALRFIFKGYQMPVKEILKNPSILRHHYETISLRLGYKVVPDEQKLEKLAEVCKKRGMSSQYQQFQDLKAKLYPEL